MTELQALYARIALMSKKLDLLSHENAALLAQVYVRVCSTCMHACVFISMKVMCPCVLACSMCEEHVRMFCMCERVRMCSVPMERVSRGQVHP